MRSVVEHRLNKITVTGRSRATYLNVTQFRLLDDWARTVAVTFHGATPYLVGSALQHANFRDVDVRIILPDDDWDQLAALTAIRRLNLAISLWGQKVTGLPIDFQIQSAAEASTEKGPRNPIGLIRAS